MSNAKKKKMVIFTCFYAYVFFIQIAPLCDELSYDSECQYCSDDTGSGVISDVTEGDPCLQTPENTCKSGVCTGKGSRTT